MNGSFTVKLNLRKTGGRKSEDQRKRKKRNQDRKLKIVSEVSFWVASSSCLLSCSLHEDPWWWNVMTWGPLFASLSLCLSFLLIEIWLSLRFNYASFWKWIRKREWKLWIRKKEKEGETWKWILVWDSTQVSEERERERKRDDPLSSVPLVLLSLSLFILFLPLAKYLCDSLFKN